jgi:hypothetical protein
MNFTITWIFDKFGFVPKSPIDAKWPFPVQKPYKPHEFEQPAKKTAKKTIKVPKATTRPKKPKK